MILVIERMDGRGHINTTRREPVKENYGDAILATKGLPEKRSASFIKVSGRMRSTAFKRRPAFAFTVIISV